jgi:hypothetical protein
MVVTAYRHVVEGIVDHSTSSSSSRSTPKKRASHSNSNNCQ